MTSPRRLEQVWQALIDVERVAPNLPGAAVTGRNDDGTYGGTFAVKIGPTSASYEGKLEMVALDEATHTASMRAEGTDKRGQGGAKATITSTVTEADDGAARVSVVTDYRITGRLARFGRGGMIEDISERLLKQFAKSLQESLATDGEQRRQNRRSHTSRRTRHPSRRTRPIHRHPRATPHRPPRAV